MWCGSSDRSPMIYSASARMVSTQHSFLLRSLRSAVRAKVVPGNCKDLKSAHFHTALFESCCSPEINKPESLLFELPSILEDDEWQIECLQVQIQFLLHRIQNLIFQDPFSMPLPELPDFPGLFLPATEADTFET